MAITMDGEVPNDLCSYRRSASHPEKRAVEIMLKAHAVSLKVRGILVLLREDP